MRPRGTYFQLSGYTRHVHLIEPIQMEDSDAFRKSLKFDEIERFLFDEATLNAVFS